mmetsp:Transcript_10148/g.32115  ORF Transcript_10148/g.32115 Transcript_10148/m.32115 type:complete len:239 (+) Transcript_10148:361-1077(+)
MFRCDGDAAEISCGYPPGASNYTCDCDERNALLPAKAPFVCRFYYIDLGTNVGWQIEKLYNPRCASPVQRLFDDAFADRRDEVCAIGFEPNPAHARPLVELEQRHAAKGRFVSIHMGFAGTRNRMSRLYLNRKTADGGRNHDWAAARVKQHQANNSFVATKEFDVVRLLLGLPTQATIVMKVDVEGDERTLFPALIRSRALCRVRTVYAEFHRGYKPPPLGCPGTRLITIDDEGACAP